MTIIWALLLADRGPVLQQVGRAVSRSEEHASVPSKRGRRCQPL
jgi:hypothetical protein